MSEQKRLFRSSSDRVIGGVAGGLARFFQIDPTFVRVAFLISALFNGIGVLVYLVMWMAVPDEQSSELTGETIVRANFEDMRAQASKFVNSVRGGANAPLLGIVLVVIGAIFLAHQLLPGIPAGVIWPVVLIAIGVYVLLARR